MIKSKIQIMALIVSYVHLRFLNTLGIKFYEIFAGVGSDIYSPEDLTLLRPVTWLSTYQSDDALYWIIKMSYNIIYFYLEKIAGNEKVILRRFIYKCNTISHGLRWYMIDRIRRVLCFYPWALVSHKKFFLHSIT